MHSLIVRLPNWVGDVIMALPTLHALQEAGVHLRLFGKPWVKDLLSGTDFNFTTLDPNFAKSRNKLAALKEDKILLLTNSLSSAVMARLSRKKCLGYLGDNRKYLLNKSIKKSLNLPEVAVFWKLGQAVIHHWFPELTWPDNLPEKIILQPDSDAIFAVKKRLKEENITSPFWVLCPFAQGLGMNKKPKIWPHWAELSKELKSKNILVCPGKKEEELCKIVVPHAKVIKDLNLAELAAMLSLAQQVVANDSGPMHIAAAVGTKTLGIFGATDPKRTSPWGAQYIGKMNAWPSVKDLLDALA